MEKSLPASPAPRQGFLRRIFSWRGLLFLAAALVTSAALLLAEENWRGGRAWKNYKRAQEAKGERFDIARLIPPPVADEQNLGALPFFNTTNADSGPMTGKPGKYSWPTVRHAPNEPYGLAEDLIDWAKAMHGPASDPAQAANTVLDFISANEPIMASLHNATRRTVCRFNVRYQDWNDPYVQGALIEQLAKIKQIYNLLALHAQAAMVAGQTDAALDDLHVFCIIDQGLADEPFLISQLVRMAGIRILLKPLGEGLVERRWSEAQLRTLQEQLQKADVLGAEVRATYGERDIWLNHAIDSHSFPGEASFMPRGWMRLEQVNLNRAFEQQLLSRIDLAAREVRPSANPLLTQPTNQSIGQNLSSAVIHHSVFAQMMIPSWSGFFQKAAFAQTEVDLATVACALERYRLAHGQYPETLAALSPEYIKELPHDVINGEPLKYRRAAPGHFILYSMGWNEKDDGGVMVMQKERPAQDITQGDWVLEYPPTK